MKQILAAIILGAFAIMLWNLVGVSLPSPLGPVTLHYIVHGIEENVGSNIVTSIVTNYRGFDTLGEVTVLFLSVSGAGFVLRRRSGVPLLTPVPASELIHTGSSALFAPMVLFGAYIFIHGHLTPGGGFQGGAVVASATMMLLLTNRDHHLPHGPLSWLESLSGFAYALVGFAGLWVAGSFLSNKGVLPLGTWNRLLSAGIIPIIYVLIGLKVGSELSALLDVMIHAVDKGEEVES